MKEKEKCVQENTALTLFVGGHGRGLVPPTGNGGPTPPIWPMYTHYDSGGQIRPLAPAIDAQVSAMALSPVSSASTTYHAQCMRNTWQVRAQREASGMAVSTP